MKGVLLSEWMLEPWYPGQPEEVVLYKTPAGWRFALVTPQGGFIDGRLGHADWTTAEAQTEMLARLRESDHVELSGDWAAEKPGWWRANLRPQET